MVVSFTARGGLRGFCADLFGGEGSASTAGVILPALGLVVRWRFTLGRAISERGDPGLARDLPPVVSRAAVIFFATGVHSGNSLSFAVAVDDGSRGRPPDSDRGIHAVKPRDEASDIRRPWGYLYQRKTQTLSRFTALAQVPGMPGRIEPENAGEPPHPTKRPGPRGACPVWTKD